MTIEEIINLIQTSEYDFLNSPPLGDNIILLGLGGSYAYGTNVQGSDIDIRGVATHNATDILTGKGFEQVVNNPTDTTVYSLEKMISLLANCNPNTIELLGLKPEHYLYLTDVGKDLIYNADMFLSRKAINSFGGYASQQLWRLKQLEVRAVDQSEREKHILNSIRNVMSTFKEKYAPYSIGDQLELYIDKSDNPELESEIFMDVILTHYPLRDYKSMWSEMHNVVKDYSKIGKRNKHALNHAKIAKHSMHLVRLYLMVFDILEDGKIITYREKEHDFLMAIRNGKYISEDGQHVLPEFYEIVEELDAKLQRLKETTPLPPNPDYDRINRFLKRVNKNIVLEENDQFWKSLMSRMPLGVSSEQSPRK